VGQNLVGVALFFAVLALEAAAPAVVSVLKPVGMLLSPNFAFMRGMYRLAINQGVCHIAAAAPQCDEDPFAWHNAGEPMAFMAGATVAYLACTMGMERRKWVQATGAVGGASDGPGAAATAAGAYRPAQPVQPVQGEDEDEDVAEERRRVRDLPSGAAGGGENIVVRGLTKVGEAKL
jgi:hypothetical protein